MEQVGPVASAIVARSMELGIIFLERSKFDCNDLSLEVCAVSTVFFLSILFVGVLEAIGILSSKLLLLDLTSTTALVWLLLLLFFSYLRICFQRC